MSQGPDVRSAVSDMLKVETQAMSAIRESIKEQSDRLEAGIARVEKLEELLKDVIGEYDRLSGQLSTQIKAVIQLQEDMKS